MIIFSGKIDSDIQHDVVHMRSKQLGYMVLMICIVVSIIAVPFIFVTHNQKLLIFFIISLILMVIMSLLLISPYTFRVKFKWNTIVDIEENNIKEILVHSNYTQNVYAISKVKKVYDYGRYYYISFYRWDLSKGIVCQRNLISNGTIEDFEKIFKDKIIRKY